MRLKGILDEYSLAFGQVLNHAKSKVFFFNISSELEVQSLRCLGFRKDALSCKYLGLPLDKGTQHGSTWNSLIGKVKEKLSSWKSRWLSWASRLTMLKFIIAALPIYMISCLQLSVGASTSINRSMKDFFWNGSRDQRKFPLIKW